MIEIDVAPASAGDPSDESRRLKPAPRQYAPELPIFSAAV